MLFKEKHNRSRMQQLPMIIVVISIAFIVSCACSTCWLFPTRPFRDSSVFRYVAYIMENGGIPYRDTFDHKGPLLYLINYVGIMLGINGVWIIELFFLIATSILTFEVVKRFCSSWLAVIGTAIVLFQLYDVWAGGNRVQEYALPFVVGSLLIFVVYFQTGKTCKRNLLLCGICFAAVLMLRVDLVTLWVTMSLCVLVMDIRQKGNQAMFFLKWFLAGTMIILLPVLIYLALNSALNDFWQQYIWFNLKYTATESSNSFETLLSIISRTATLISIAVLCILLLVDRDRRFFTVISLVYTVLTIVVTAVPGRSFSYNLIILMPTLILPAALLLSFIEARVKSTALIAICTIAAVFLSSISWLHLIYWGPDAVPFDKMVEIDLSKWVSDNTNPEDTIIVCGNYDLIYVLSNRKAASRYSYQMPIAKANPVIYEEFIDEIIEKQPKIVIWSDNDLGGFFELSHLKKRIEEFIEKYEYVQANSYSGYTLYTRDSHAAPIKKVIGD